MASIKTAAIVARCANYGESDRMLTLITPGCGRMDVSSRGCRKPKSKLLACSQPFCFGEYVLSEFGGRFTVAQCDLRESFYDLRLDLDRLESAAQACAVCAENLQEGQQNEEMFSLCYHMLSFLCYGESSPADLMLCFTAKLLSVLGYGPTTVRCALCGASTFSGGRFHAGYSALCAKCAERMGGEAVAPLTLEALRRMIALPDRDMGKVVLPAGVRGELAAILPAYYEAHLERRFKPAEFLQRLVREEKF